jgi:opacity protein-like surface antigen
MKKLLIATVVAVISSGAFAADLKPYIEGQLGRSNLNDVDTQATSVPVGAGTATASAKIEYDNSVSGGFEIGANNVGIENLRIGASYNRMKFDMEKVTGTATAVGVTGFTDNVPVTGDITPYVRDAGVSLDNSVKLYMANAYYDIKNASAFTPFVGLGIGMADIQNAKDNEFAWSASVGGKYNIDKNMYLGLKGSYTSVNGITDKIGLEYKDMDAYSAHALLGYQF